MSQLHIGTSPDGEAVHLKADRLRTHGVIVGMTGSGKTGLGLVLLEELLEARVPVIAIDPKGDLGNLGLLFPEFKPDDFAPWVGKDDPEKVAQKWQTGLLRGKITGAQVRALKDGIDLAVYTPGSTAGLPIDLLGLLSAPKDMSQDLTDAVEAAVSGLMGLAGKKTDPVRDPAHVVLSRILHDAWKAGESIDLSTLVLRLVDPPFAKVGVFPLDRFFPPDDRMDLAMAFNAILSAPSFGAWRTGVHLDPARLLDADGDRTPVSVFALAHLEEAERQFFVSLLLSRLLSWSRAQPGTDGLRALVFLDEASGYIPPHPYNPPSKAPLLTLMKQARAVGLGVVLSTQNPVDLDYKALSNAGTWCIGRLTTKQDRDRLLKGIDARDLDSAVAKLEKRQFVLHEIGRGAPQVFGSRHAMAYLRGPLTQSEFGALNELWGKDVAAAAQTSPAGPSAAPSPQGGQDDLLPAPPVLEGTPARYLDPRVVFSARFEGAFDRFAEPASDGHPLTYRPALRAEVDLRFDETKGGFVLDETLHRVWFPLGKDGLSEAPLAVALEEADLLDAAPDNARFALLPEWLDTAREVKSVARRLKDDIYRSESRGQFINPELKLYAHAEESEEEFRARCEKAVEDLIDEAAAKLKESFEKKADRLEDRLEKKRAQHAELKGVARSRQLEEVVNLGATVLSFFGGRSRRLTSAMTKRRQSSQAAARVDRLEGEIEGLEDDAIALEQELEVKLATIEEDNRAALDATEAREVRLEKSDVGAPRLEILWVPVSRRL